MRARPIHLAATVAVVVAALGAGLAGCGDDDGSSAGRVEDGSEQTVNGDLRLDVGSEPDPPKTGEPVTWLLTVRNEGSEEVTLRFSSGKSGDVVLAKAGQEVYRWSADRFFTEAIRQEPLAPNEEKVYRLDESGLAIPRGEYELTATLESEPAPDARRRTVTIDGPP